MTKTILSKKQKILIFNFKKNISDTIFTLAVLLIMILIIANPAIFSESTISGIKLFFYSVLPGLFPFMFLTKMLTELGTAFKISKKFDKFSSKVFGTRGISMYCFFMSILSGYPIGAKIIADLSNKNIICDEEAKRMSIFCTTSGPIFVIGAVGVGMLKSFKLGLIIYICHILSSVICGVVYNQIFKFTPPLNHANMEIEKTNNLFSKCLSDTISSLLMVGGYITIFYLFSEVLDLLGIVRAITNFLSPLLIKLKITKTETSGILYAITEVTHGVKVLSMQPQPKIAIICGLISFSGVSIIMQSLTFLKQAKIKTHSFIATKCVQMVLAIILCTIALRIW